MFSVAEVLERYPIQLDARTLRRLVDELNHEIQVYDGLVKRFESQHGCDLKTFEAMVKGKQVPEHPSWEIAIEWGTANDELERLTLVRRALEWILNFLN